MGLFHRRGKQLKTKQDLRECWEQQLTDDAPRTTTARTDKTTESRLHDKGQDGNDANRGNEGQSDKAHTVADTHDEDKDDTVTASNEATTENGTSEVVDGTDETTVSHMNNAATEDAKVTEDVESADDATTAIKNVEPAHETDSDKAATVNEETRSQTVHDESDETETGSVEREPVGIPATPVTDAVAGRSDEIPHLEVSTVSADEADAASITSTFGAQANNAAQETEQSADDEVTES